MESPAAKEGMRYQRQIVLPEIGPAGQKKLRESRVLIIGVGGLGSPAALYLAAAGIEELGLVDGDHVDVTNLQRQVLFRSDDEGKRKVEAAREALRALNPEVRIQCFRELFSPGNAEEIASQYDLVIDGTDNFPAKFLIGDACRALGIPLVHGSVNGFEGRVAVFSGNSGPCFRCLYPEPPRERIQNCAEAGVLGSVAGTIGCVQATEAVKYLLAPESHKTTLFVFDAWQLHSRVLEIAPRPDCPFCHAPFDANRSEYQTGAPMSCPAEIKVPSELTPEEMEKYPECVLVDIREPDEWNEGHIPGAVHWPMMRIVSGNQPLDPGRHYVLYCHSGGRSASALQFLRQKGIANVSHLRGGILSWFRHQQNR